MTKPSLSWTIVQQHEKASRIASDICHNWIDKYVPNANRDAPDRLRTGYLAGFLADSRPAKEYFKDSYLKSIDLAEQLPLYLTPLPAFWTFPEIERQFTVQDRELLNQFFSQPLSELPFVVQLAESIKVTCNQFVSQLDNFRNAVNKAEPKQTFQNLYKAADEFRSALKEIPNGALFAWPV